MIPKKNRIDKKTIENLFNKGFFVHTKNISFKYVPRDNQTTKFSFITPKAVAKRAVKRNQLKRRGYYVLKKHINEFSNGLTGAFIYKKNALKEFGGKKTNKFNPIYNLEVEIREIIKKYKKK